MKFTRKIVALAICLGCLFSSDLWAASPKSALLWNSWYTMTVNGKIPYGYYNDRVERKDGKIAYQNQLWKKEEGFINEERVVSFGKDDDALTPLLFNFLGTYRNTELSIDGTFSGTKLKVKSRKKNEALPAIETTVPTKAFLSTLFQAWLGKNLSNLKLGHETSFTTLFEDSLDSRYASVHGSVTLEKDDALALKNGSKKLAVDLGGVKSTWYVKSSGEAIRIEKPDQHLVIEKKSEDEARRFLTPRTDGV